MTEPVNVEQDIDLAPVEELMRLMALCQRAIILYKPNNPVYQEAAKNLQTALQKLWTQMEELLLRVRDDGFTWHEHVVLTERSKSDSIAWVLYKDGVIAIRITPGAEEEELLRFLNMIHTVRTLPEDAEDDFRTLLWAGDYQKIKCDLAGVGYEGTARPLERSDHFEAAPAPTNVRQAVARAVERPEGIVSIEDFDSTLYFLDDDEVHYLNDEIEREYSRDVRSNVLAMLFDVLELEREPAVADDVVSILDEFLPYLLGVGDIHAVSYIVREAHTVTERAGRLEAGLRDRLTAFAAKVAEPDALDQLLQTLDRSEVAPADEDLAGLFGELQPQAIETALAWLPRLGNDRAKELLAYAIDQLAIAHPEAVNQAFASEDETVVLGALSLVTRLNLQTDGPEIEQLSSHRESEVRQALADALGAVATPNSFLQLEGLLDDTEREVRIRAVRHLRHQRDALPRITAAISGKTLRSADLTEKRAFFETFGILAGDAGVGRLRLLLRTGWFRHKVDAETRACAAMALGQVASKEARNVLKKLRNDKEPLVRNAVNKALQEVQS